MPYNRLETSIAQEKKALIVAMILFFNLILLSTQIILKNRQSLLIHLLSNAVGPFQTGVHKATEFVSREWKRYFFLRGIYRKYQEQKKKNIRLQFENYLLKQQLREHKLRKGVEGKFPRYELVNTVSVDINFPFHTLVIDRGKSDGIRENLPVLNLAGDLVGKTVQPVFQNTATVRLITSSLGGVGAFIEENHFEGIVSGNNNSTCNFKYLMENKPVHNGEHVLTSGIDGVFPPDIPIGRITSVEKDYLTQKIELHPFFLNKSIRQLLVLNDE